MLNPEPKSHVNPKILNRKVGTHITTPSNTFWRESVLVLGDSRLRFVMLVQGLGFGLTGFGVLRPKLRQPEQKMQASP